MNATDNIRELVRVTVQLSPDTLPHPDHPPKSEKIVGVAVSVTCVPVVKVPVHGFPDAGAQKRPGGLLVIVPVPVPTRMTLITPNTARPFTKVTVAVLAALPKITVQTVPVTLSQPLQPPKLEPGEGIAVSFACEPLGKTAVHWFAAGPQLIPVGLLVTVPVPVPLLATVRETSLTNVAVTERGAPERRTAQFSPAT